MKNASSVPKKSLGQHWLKDSQTLNEICENADLDNNDVVLEIGPGLGDLTRLLTEKAKEVIAVELDDKLSADLPLLVAADNLTIVHDSILKYDLSTLPTKYKIVANIPYYLTSNLLRLLSESNNPPSLVVLLVQKEVAERVAAKPGDMSLLSVTTQYYWEVELKQTVKANMFIPPPKVDSQVILLNRRLKPLFPGTDDKSFFRLVRIGFSARRKTLLNSMTNGLRIEKALIDEVLELASIDKNARPQTLNLDEWWGLYQVCLSKKLI